jgi:hypothetical protein
MAVDDKAVAAVADSSSAAEEKSSTQILKDLTPKQMKTWRETGNLPDEKATADDKKAEEKDSKKSTDGDSSTPAKKDVAAPKDAESGAKKAEEPAKSAVADKTEPAKANAETRIKDLLAENKILQQKLEDLQKQPVAVAKKESEPAKPSRNDTDPKTGAALYATDEDYLDARDKYVAEMASRKTRADIAKESSERNAAEQNQLIERRMLNSIKIAKEKHADFLEVLKAKDIEKDGKTITVFDAPAVKAIKQNGVLDAWILDSEIGMEILYYLATRIEEVERIQSLNAFSAARELTKLEEKLSEKSAVAAKKEEGSPAQPDKKVSGAPAPAAAVGGKATAPADEVEAATLAGDFKRFQKAENEADWRKKKAS